MGVERQNGPLRVCRRLRTKEGLEPWKELTVLHDAPCANSGAKLEIGAVTSEKTLGTTLVEVGFDRQVPGEILRRAVGSKLFETVASLAGCCRLDTPILRDYSQKVDFDRCVEIAVYCESACVSRPSYSKSLTTHPSHVSLGLSVSMTTLPASTVTAADLPDISESARAAMICGCRFKS